MSSSLERFQRAALLLTAIVFPAGYAPLGLLLLLAAAIWETAVTRRIPWQRTSLDGLLAAFAAAFALSGVLSPFPGTALGSLLLAAISIYLGYGVLSHVLTRDPDFLRPFLGAWVIGGVAAAGWAIVLSRTTGRAAFLPELHQNELATTLLTSLLLALPGVSVGRWWRRVVMMGGMIVMTLALLLTDGRGAWLGVLAGAILFMIFGGIRRTWRSLVLLLVVGIALGAVAQSELTSISSRIRSVFSLSFYTNRVRIALAETAIAIFRDHPVTGTGLGTFARVHPTYRSSYYPELPPHSSAHNVLLNMAAEGGILGLVTFSAIIVAALAAGLHRLSRPGSPQATVMRAAVVATYAGLVLDQQFATTIISVHLGTGFWLLTATLAAFAPATEPTAAPVLVSSSGVHQAVLLVSNGHGEDAVGMALARELTPQVSVTAYPLVGTGGAYAGIRLLDPRRLLPSGGFGFRSNLRGLWADARAGVLQLWWHQRATLRGQQGQHSLVIAVGDFYCLWMAAQAGNPVLLIATAKSEYSGRHEWLELLLMRKHAAVVFARDALTAEALRRVGVAAKCVGNPLMDTIQGDEEIQIDRNRPTIVLLPGSRDDARANLALMLHLCKTVASQMPVNIVAALAPSVESQSLRATASSAGWKTDDHVLQLDSTEVRLTRSFGRAIRVADVVVGMAGTASEQAAGLGKPIVAFPGPGPQFTRQFLDLQKRLLGDALVATRNWQDGAEAVLRLLRDPAERARRGAVGRDRMGGSGAVQRIADEILRMLRAG